MEQSKILDTLETYQAPRAWYDTLKEFLMKKGFKPGSLNPTLFTKTYDDELFVCQIYIDDLWLY